MKSKKKVLIENELETLIDIILDDLIFRVRKNAILNVENMKGLEKLLKDKACKAIIKEISRR